LELGAGGAVVIAAVALASREICRDLSICNDWVFAFVV
jgi:hypothetical protein